jgi:DNA repair ATPase RecN
MANSLTIACIASRLPTLSGLTKDLQTLQHAEQHRVQRLDLLRFQAEEIDKAQLHSDEEERLAAEHHLLLNAEKLYELSQDAYALLYRNEHALLETLAEVRDKLEQLAALDTRQNTLGRDTRELLCAGGNCPTLA